MRWRGLAVVVLAGACGEPGMGSVGSSGAESGTDAGAESGTDADADSDADANSDADADTDAGSDADADSDADSGTGSGTASESSSDGSTGELERPPAIGLVQYDGDAHFGDAEFNTASLTSWAEAAIAEGATIIVFPEGSTHGYASASEVWCSPGETQYSGFACRDVSTVAEPLPGGPTTDYWTSFAAEHDVTVVYHVIEADGADFYNAVGIVDANGFVDRYRKRLLYYIDQAYATPGDEPTVLDTPAGPLGLMICIDGTYDGDYYDDYLALGVDRIINVMDWDDDPNGPAAAIDWFRDRAENNGVEIFAADVSTWDGTGHYLPGNVPRERHGLPAIAVGVDGISVHALAR